MNNAQLAFDYFVGQGLSPVQAAGIVGNLQGESGQGLNPLAVNKGDGRDGSDSVGIAQWNGPRAQALRDYAASKGVAWNDLNTQLEFLHSELKGPESRAYKALLAAQSPEEAARAFLGFERPKDWNVPGSHPERAKYATAALAAYGGGQPQPPQASPASPANGLLQQAAPPLQIAQMPTGGLGAAPQAQPDIFSQMPVPQAPPIFFAPRRAPDLRNLQASLKAPVFKRG